MPDPILRSEDYPEGYRLTSTSRGLRIECLGGDARPLSLDADQLARFGLGFLQEQFHPTGRPGEHQDLVNQILSSLDRALALLQSQPQQPAGKWDIGNLKRVRTLLGSLDPDVVEETLGRKGGAGGGSPEG